MSPDKFLNPDYTFALWYNLPIDGKITSQILYAEIARRERRWLQDRPAITGVHNLMFIMSDRNVVR